MKHSRRVLHWNRVRDIRSALAVFIGTASGAGLFPFAPGTLGTLVGLPLAYLVWNWPMASKTAFWIALSALGTWACKTYDEVMDSHDNQNLVIDEVAGVGITSFTIGLFGKSSPEHFTPWLAAFVIFRAFDILKPPPVRQVDRWSKSGSPWRSAFGVMADDLLAGALGLIVMILLQKFEIL